MVDMFLPQTKAADDCEGARRAPRALKGKAERSIGSRASGGGAAAWATERTVAKRAKARRSLGWPILTSEGVALVKMEEK